MDTQGTMPTWLKVVLGVVLASVVLCGGGIGGFTFWLKANEGKLKETGTRAKAEAAEFAKSSDQEGCEQEALRQLKATPGFMAEVEHRLFLTECLKAAAPSPGFCDGVPKPGDIMAGAQFAVDECASYDGPKESCQRMMQEVTKHCAGEK